MQVSERHRQYWQKNLRITGILLAIWFVVTFVVGLLRPRPELQFLRLAVQFLGGGPGGIDRLRDHHLVLRPVHEQARQRARRRTRRTDMAGMFEHGAANDSASTAVFKKQLNKVYGWYTGGFLAFVVVLAILEQMGLPKNWIGFIFLLATVGLYAGIGIMSRTSDAAEYYVAGRRVPAIYNGMATGADWMSAASFIGMAGTLYLTGYGGLAFILGWTGGYCLVALFLAPYLRKFGQFTIPDFLGARYRRQPAALHRHPGRDPVLVHLRGGADLRRGPDHHAAVGPGFRDRHLRRPGRHPGVLVPRRHACRHLDPGGAVHHPDHCLHDSGGLAVGQADRRADSAGRLRLRSCRRSPSRRSSFAPTRRNSRSWPSSRRAPTRPTPSSRTCLPRMAADQAAAQKKLDDLKAANGPAADVQAAEKALAALPKTPADATKAYTAAKTSNDGRARPLGGMPAPRARSTPATPTATPPPRRPSTSRVATSWRWCSA